MSDPDAGLGSGRELSHTWTMDDTIVPDDKDWTWVLERPCPECGYEAATLARADVGAAIRTNAGEWARLLAGDAGAVRARPRPDRWSTLEYGAHVRDVYRLFQVRLALMLGEDDPLFANWDQDETALADDYGAQDPAVVAVELVEAAALLAAAFDAVTGAQWQRPGRRSDGARFTVESFARYLVHDPVHHVWDVTAAR